MQENHLFFNGAQHFQLKQQPVDNFHLWDIKNQKEETLEVMWYGVNDISAVDFCGDGCNKKITKTSKKTSRIASGLPLDSEKSSLIFSFIYIKNSIYRLGETFFFPYAFKNSPEFFIKSYKKVQNT